MAGLSDTTVIAGDGTATIVLQNPSTVRHLRVENLTVQIADEDNEVTARAFDGLPNVSNQRAASVAGHDDVAIGPYHLGPGSFITVTWEGATPGLKAAAWLTASPLEIAPIEQGSLRFGSPGTGASIRIVTQNIVRTGNIAAGGGSEVIEFIPPAGRVWSLLNFDQPNSIPYPGGTGIHRVQLRQHVDNMVAEDDALTVVFYSSNSGQLRVIYSDVQFGGKTPADASAFALAVRNVYATATHPAIVRYLNECTQPQTNNRTWRFSWLETLA